MVPSRSSDTRISATWILGAVNLVATLAKNRTSANSTASMTCLVALLLASSASERLSSALADNASACTWDGTT